MDDKQKNAIMVALLSGLIVFNIIWWSTSGWVSLLAFVVGGAAAAAGYFGTHFLS